MAAAAGFPVGYAAAPAYTPSVYAGANPAFASGKTEPEQLRGARTEASDWVDINSVIRVSNST